MMTIRSVGLVLLIVLLASVAVQSDDKVDLPDRKPRTAEFQPVCTEQFSAFLSEMNRAVGERSVRTQNGGIIKVVVTKADQLLSETGPLTQWEKLDRDDEHTRDFNKYDEQFKLCVAYWAEQTGVQLTPEQVTVLADFIKHMAMVESNMGYSSGYKPEGEDWIDTEDVMQVANPRDPAMRTMRGDTNEKWKTGKGENRDFKYDTRPRRQIGLLSTPSPAAPLTYKNISGNESIFWGVRWFFHQLTKGENGWRNGQPLTKALLLQAAVHYNGGGDPDYKKKLLTALEKGASAASLPTPAGRKAPSTPVVNGIRQTSTLWGTLD